MRRRDDQRGAVALLIAVMLSLLMIIGAFAIDLGMQRVAARDAQAAADVIALDAARELNGAPRVDVETAVRAAFRASRDRNSTGLGAQPDRFVIDLVTRTEWGEYRSTRANEVPDAVEVRVVGAVDRLFSSGSGGVLRTAYATRSESDVCFQVGARLLTLDTAGGALSPILDGVLRVNLAAVGYDGLVNLKDVSIPLVDLAVALDAGTTDELVATRVTLSDLLAMTADVLAANRDPVSAAILRAIRLGVAGLGVQIGDILDVAAGTPTAGLDGSLNVFDLVSAGILAANGENAVAISVPGVTHIKVIEPPRTACARPGRPASARSAQIQIAVQTQLPTNDVRLTSGGVDLVVDVGAASAMYVSSNGCTDVPSVELSWETAGVRILPPRSGAFGQVNLVVTSSAFLGQILSLLGEPGLLNVLRNTVEGVLTAVGQVGLDVEVAGEVAANSGRYPFEFASGNDTASITIPSEHDTASTALQLSAVRVRLTPGQSLVGALGLILNPALALVLEDLVRPLVNTVVSPALGAVLEEVSELVGLRVGTADLRVLGRPSCDRVALIG